MELEIQQQKFCLGSVVWYHPDTETGWWPCAVTEVDGEERIHLQALGDGHIYGLVSLPSAKLRRLTCTNSQEMVRKQLHKFKKRSNTLGNFVSAVGEAQMHDPSFQLDMKLPDLLSQASPQSPQIGANWSALNDSNVFTPGTCSRPDGTNGSSRRRSLRSVTLPRTQMTSHSMPKSVKSDILMHSGSSRRHKKRRASKEREVGSERKKIKAEEQAGELGVEDSESNQPIRKRLFETEESACGSDILTACGGDLSPESASPKRRKRSSESAEMVGAAASEEDRGEDEAEERGRLENKTEEHSVASASRKSPKRRKKKRLHKEKKMESSDKIRNSNSSSSSPVGERESVRHSSSSKTPEQETNVNALHSAIVAHDEVLPVTPLLVRSGGEDSHSSGEKKKQKKKKKKESKRGSREREDRGDSGELGEGEEGEGREEKESDSMNGEAGDRERGKGEKGGEEREDVCEETRETQMEGVSRDVIIQQQESTTSTEEGNPLLSTSSRDNPEAGKNGKSTTGEKEVGDKREGEGREAESYDSSTSEEDDFPTFPTTSSTKVIVSDLQVGDLIWSKYKQFPHWPALVVEARPSKKKSNSIAKIVYFGDNVDYDPVIIKQKLQRNLARFVIGNDQYEEFMKAGREWKYSDYFLRSVHEAESFITAKYNKEITGTALEMYRQICERRPASQEQMSLYKKWWSLMKPQGQQKEAATYSAFGVSLDITPSDSDSEEDDEKKEAEEEDKENLYTLDGVLLYFTALKPHLEGIMRGSVPSEYRRLFLTGTAREKHTLKTCSKFGPCQKWGAEKHLTLINHLVEMAKGVFGEGSQFHYSTDVLLPEAMIRTISHFEGISEQEALERL